jgi:hypothetical protein
LRENRFPRVHTLRVKAKFPKETQVTVAPFLVPDTEAARLLSSSVEEIDLLIKQGLLGTRTIGDRRLVRFSTIEEFAGRNDPMSVIFPSSEGTQ